MVDTFSKKIRRKTMQAVKSKDTKLEQSVYTELWKKGMQFRKNVDTLYGKPDIAIKKYKIVIFIDSCFWHGCHYHCRMPKSNRAYWNAKIKRNKERDKEVKSWYKKNKWAILRFWEHNLRNNLQNCLKKITKAIKAKKP